MPERCFALFDPRLQCVGNLGNDVRAFVAVRQVVVDGVEVTVEQLRDDEIDESQLRVVDHSSQGDQPHRARPPDAHLVHRFS